MTVVITETPMQVIVDDNGVTVVSVGIQGPEGGEGEGGGDTDHGALTGLADDDHTQYHNDTRGDARYYTKSQSDAAYQPKAAVLTGTTASFTTAQESKLAGIASGATANSSDATLLARANHTGEQAISTVTGLQALLNLLDLASGTWLGRYAGTFYTTSNDAASSFVTYGGGANAMRGVPFKPSGAMTIKSISLYVTTGSSGRTAKVVIYEAGADGMPGALLYEGTSDLDCSTTNSVISQSCNLALEAGKTYWAFVRLSGAGVSLRANGVTTMRPMGHLSVTGSAITGLLRTLTYANAAPNPFSFTSADYLTAINTPLFYFEV